MLSLQETIYSNNKNAYAQRQGSFMEMVADHVLYGQLKQGRILSHFGPMAGSLPTHRLENGSHY